MTCGLCGASAQQKLQAWLLGLRSPLSLQCRCQLTRPHRSTPTCKAACSPLERQAPIYKDTWNQEWVTHGSLGAPAVSTPSLKVINPRSVRWQAPGGPLNPIHPSACWKGPSHLHPAVEGAPSIPAARVCVAPSASPLGPVAPRWPVSPQAMPRAGSGQRPARTPPWFHSAAAARREESQKPQVGAQGKSHPRTERRKHHGCQLELSPLAWPLFSPGSR